MPDQLLHQSREQRRHFFSTTGDLLQELAKGQSPEALFIGCADSRVVPEHLFGLAPGQWFMLRNVGNVVPPYWQTEIAVAATLEYAIHYLGVAHIIVCGHTDCGAILGLDMGVDLSREPALARWLELARPGKRAVDSQSHDDDEHARHVAIVERNVVHQLDNLASYPFIRNALETGRVQLHGWVYYLEQQQVGAYDAESDRFVT